MPNEAVSVRDLAPQDYPAWRALWDGYCQFYETSVPEDTTIHTWNRLLDPGVDMFARVALLDGEPVAFVHCVVHPATWVVAPTCYLEDLYTHPDHRGKGLGRALIEDVLALCRQRNYARLYWHTDRGNTTARKLYDQFVPADDFVRYRIFV